MSSVSRSSSGSPNRGCRGIWRSAAMFMAAGACSEEAFFHGDDVSRMHRLVLAHALRGLARVVVADHEYLFLRGAFLEAASQRHGFAYGKPRHVGVTAGLFH